MLHVLWRIKALPRNRMKEIALWQIWHIKRLESLENRAFPVSLLLLWFYSGSIIRRNSRVLIIIAVLIGNIFSSVWNRYKLIFSFDKIKSYNIVFFKCSDECSKKYSTGLGKYFRGQLFGRVIGDKPIWLKCFIYCLNHLSVMVASYSWRTE